MTENIEKESIEDFKKRVSSYGLIYYDRKGKEISFEEWNKKTSDLTYRILNQESVGPYLVSTIWLGLNMNVWRRIPPIIFETMIFHNNKDFEENPLNNYQERYYTEESAFVGHKTAVEAAQAQLIKDNA